MNKRTVAVKYSILAIDEYSFRFNSATSNIAIENYAFLNNYCAADIVNWWK